MAIQQAPPLSQRLVDGQGNITPIWRRWFQSLKVFDDQISQPPTETYTGNRTLTVRDFGKNIKFNNGANPVTCYLPSVGSTDVSSWLQISKLGTGRLRIQASDSDTIGKSSVGGAIISVEPNRVENVRLYLESETHWDITGGIGIWNVV